MTCTISAGIVALHLSKDGLVERSEIGKDTGVLINRSSPHVAPNVKPIPSKHILVWLWVGLLLVRGCLYLFLVPPWQAPDEPTAIELLLTIQARGRLVSIADKDPAIEHQIVEAMRRSRYWALGGFAFTTAAREGQSFDDIYGPGNTQLHRPPLYQVSLLPIIWLTRGWPLEHQLMLLRAANLVLGALTVVAAVLIGRQFAVVHPAIAFILPAMVGLHPQFAYSSATFNADNLATTLSAGAFLIMLWMTQQGLAWRYVIALVLLLVLGLWTKRTTLFIAPTVSIAMIMAAWRAKRPLWRRDKRWLTYGTTLLLLASGISIVLPQTNGWFRASVEQYVLNTNLREYYRYITFGFARLDAPLLPTLWHIISFFNLSFWASYSWHSVNAPHWLAATLLTCTLVTWCSACIYGVMAQRALPSWVRDYMALCVFAVITTLLLIFVNRFPFGLIPGRYLFPAILPVLLFMALGLCCWWPQRWSVPGTTCALLALVTLDFYTIWSVVIPGFYHK